ncbi:TfoX/Sxy family protein [Candidatus Saccharibacteria bacterium]|nr:TfoX/Sxy family protein [Candidatus Saccharibacteria bacterium]
MAYDTHLEAGIDKLTLQWGLGKKPMFGGLGYFLGGNMCFGIHKDELIVRATEEQGKELLKEPGMRPFDMSRHPMKTWFMGGGNAISDSNNLLKLLEIGRDYALNLPPK